MNRLQQNPLAYDKDGEMHYDIISAFIKSIRGSDPDAALYWLARMIEGGEDPQFIARRLVISAAEDIGLANPNALLLANAAFDAVMKIGWPEGRIPLAEATVYLATSPKSNSAYLGVDAALALVKQTGNQPVPLPIRNAPTQLMKELGYHDGYKYPHDYPGHFTVQQYLPDALQNERLWHIADFHNEHRILTARLVFEIIVRTMGHFDFTVCMAIGAVFLFGYGLLFKRLFTFGGVGVIACDRFVNVTKPAEI